MKFAYDSNIGRVRQVNQDRACVLKNKDHEIFGIVCDGMGGHQAGEYAASMAIESLCQSFLSVSPLRTQQDGIAWLKGAIQETNREIYADSLSNCFHKGMGTTVACCLILDKTIIIAHVGDSRVYSYEHQHLTQLTKDHTYVNLLVESGTITKEEAKIHPKKNILMKALGVFEEVVPTITVLEKNVPFLLICSDGLYNALSDEEMIHILESKDVLAQKVIDLIEASNKNGGSDNISVVLLDGGEIE